MGAKQAKISRGRPLMLNTANIDGEPDNGYESPADALPLQLPHHVMSPRVLPGFPTTGLIIGLTQPSGAIVPATAVAAGFELVVWLGNPTGWFWHRCDAVTLDYRDAAIYCFDAFPIYLQIVPASVAVPGDIIFTITEQ